MKLSHAVPRLHDPYVERALVVPLMKMVKFLPPLLLALCGMVHAQVPAAASGYKLQPGDVLTVNVWKETDLKDDILIRPDGGLSFALAGELQAAGHTVAELTTMLESRIRKYIPDAVVTVSVKASAGNRIYVIGKVNRAGDFPLLGPIDVMQAITRCRLRNL